MLREVLGQLRDALEHIGGGLGQLRGVLEQSRDGLEVLRDIQGSSGMV